MIKIPTRVLLVDDEKDFVEMLALRLRGSRRKSGRSLQWRGMPGEAWTVRY